MQKNTKILLGVGALAVAGYFIWKNNQPKDIFRNATASKDPVPYDKRPCPCKKLVASANGTDLCASGHICRKGVASLYDASADQDL
jgi:hypothetical protein